MLNYSRFNKEVELLSEMPWITVNGRTFDLEVEMHSMKTGKEFIEYVKDWVGGGEYTNKSGQKVSVPKDIQGKFATALFTSELLGKMVAKKYGQQTLDSLQRMLAKFAV